MKKHIIILLLLIASLSICINNVSAASWDDTDVLPCANETQEKTKTWTIEIYDSSDNNKLVAKVKATMTGIYSSVDRLRRITGFNDSIEIQGNLSQDFRQYLSEIISTSTAVTGTYDRQLVVAVKNHKGYVFDFTFLSNFNMKITNPEYNNQSVVKLYYNFNFE